MVLFGALDRAIALDARLSSTSELKLNAKLSFLPCIEETYDSVWP